MRHAENLRLTGKAVTAAVAAALLAMASGAGAETLTRISTSINEPDTDIEIHYSSATADSDVIYAPVEPGAEGGITVTANSLTITNDGSSDNINRTYGGIATNSNYSGSDITLNIADDLSVTAPRFAIKTSDGSSVTATIGGDLTLTISHGNTINVTDNGQSESADAATGSNVTLKLNGGKATIQSLETDISGHAISIWSAPSVVRIEGASETVISSMANGIYAQAGRVEISGAGENGSEGSISVVGHGTGSAGIYTYGGSVTLQAGSVKVWGDGEDEEGAEGTGGSSIVARAGSVHITSFDPNGTGVQLLSFNGDKYFTGDVPVIMTMGFAGESAGSVTIEAMNSPIEILNEADVSSIMAMGGNVSVNSGQMATSVKVNGDITASQASNVGIYETGTGSYLKANNVKSEGGSSVAITLHGDAVMGPIAADQDKTSVVSQDFRSFVVVQAQDTASVAADFTSSGGASTSLSLAGNSTLTGNLHATGIAPDHESDQNDNYRSLITFTFTENSTYTGDSTVEDGGHIYGVFAAASAMKGNITVTGQSSGGVPSTFSMNGSGTASYTGNMDVSGGGAGEVAVSDSATATGDYTVKDANSILYRVAEEEGVINGTTTASAGGTAGLFLMGSAVLNGDVSGTGSGTKVNESFEPGTTVNGNLTSSDGAAVTTSFGGTWNGTSTLSGGTTDLEFTDASAVWNMAAASEVTSLKQSSGTINFPAAPSTGFTGTTLTIDGDYSADGGTVNMNTVLQGDASAHDEIIVNGNTSGTANLVFTKVSGWGSQTVDGIKVVQVGGDSDAVFTKPESNRLTAGAYIYELKKIGSDWYLTSQRDPDASKIILPKTIDDPDPVQPDVIPAVDPTDPAVHYVKPELGSYAANMLASNTLFTMSLYDRLGETRYSDALKSQKKSGNVWICLQGGKNHTNMYDDQLTNRGTYGIVQVGGDLVTWPGSGDHRFHVGLMGGYAHQSTKTRSSDIGLTSKGKLSGYSAGFYATYMNDKPEATGPYADLWMIYQHFTDKVHASSAAEEEYHSKGWTGSLEAGYTFGLKDWVSASGTQNATRLQLQAQVIRMGVRADEHVDAENFTVQGTGAGNVRTRIGATAYHLFTNPKTGRAIKPYLILNWYHDTKNFGVVYDGVKDRIEGTRNFGEVKFGIEGKVSKNVNLWGAALYQAGSHSYWNAGAFVGAKILF
jgi:autotransporter family porin